MAKESVLEGEVQFLVVALFPALFRREADHLTPHSVGNAGAAVPDELTAFVELRVSVIVDLHPPGDHLKRGSHVGFGGGCLGGDLPEPLAAVSGGPVLGS